MKSWSGEIEEAEKYCNLFKEDLPDLAGELEQLISTGDANVVLLYARRCLELVVTELCENRLHRPRKTEPLKGVIDKLNKEEIIPSHVNTAMLNLNSLSTYGVHPKEYSPHQVRNALLSLFTVLDWYLEYKDLGGPAGATKTMERLQRSTEEKTGTTAAEENSIVVLPFMNISPDKEQDYFCEGITEEIINTLTHIESLKVIARTTSFAFKDKYEDVRDIGRELNVKTLLEGSVRKAGNKLRITAQLINVSDGAHLWSEKFDREMQDVFEIQDEISLAIVGKLKVQFFAQERQQILKNQTKNVQAYQLYLKGRYHWNKRTSEELEKSIGYFEQSLAEDPEYALAHCAMADAYIILADWGYMLPEEACPRAKGFLLKSLEIDDRLAEAYVSLAYVTAHYEWNWEKAGEQFMKALRLNPNHPKINQWYALNQVLLGHFKEAIDHVDKAIQLDPLSMIYTFAKGYIMMTAGRYDDAVKNFHMALVIDQHFFPASFWASVNYLQLEKYDETVEEYINMLSLNPLMEKYIPIVRDIYATSGISGFLEWLIGEGVLLDPRIYNRPAFLAVFHAALGNKEHALEMLTKCIEMHSIRIPHLLNLPVFDFLRADPRFTEFYNIMGLSEQITPRT